MRRLTLCLLLLCFSASLGVSSASASLPPIKHVFVVVLENQDYSTSFGSSSKAPYLAHTLPAQGALLTHYFGTGHESLDNYITMISGQPPNPYTQADAPAYVDFVGMTGSDGVATGQGSIYPTDVKTVADQLSAKGLTWRGYMEDMGNDPTREPKTCGHVPPNTPDVTQKAAANDQYAQRHDPFVYFHSIIDDQARCDAGVVPLTRLQPDLSSASTTPNYVFVTPNLCNDGHDTGCANGDPGGLVSVDRFLRTWVPRITGSPAFADGMLIVLFDESATGAESCCNEPTGPNTPNNGGPTMGDGGGRVGAVVLSPFVRPGTVDDVPYNHYSLLRSVEDIFGLPHLADAAISGLNPFGGDLFNRPGGGGGGGIAARPLRVRVSGVPKGCARRRFVVRVRVTGSGYRGAQGMVDHKRVTKSRRMNFRFHVGVSRLRRGRHRVTVRAAGPGRSVRRTVRFRICG